MDNIEIIDELKKELEHLKQYKGADISDIGNSIGFVIGAYISNEMGYEKESFMAGLNHGFSLRDGTH